MGRGPGGPKVSNARPISPKHLRFLGACVLQIDPSMTSGTFGRAILLALTLSGSAAMAVEGADAVPVFQGEVGARIFGPRRVAATSSGQFVVVDARGRMHLLTQRGDLIGVVLEGVRAVTTGGGKIFAVTERAEFVTLEERYGKVLGRVSLGLGEAPAGLAYDEVRKLVWMVSSSGMVQAHRLDGSVALQPDQATTGFLWGWSTSRWIRHPASHGLRKVRSGSAG